jgi:serine/threonine-protein kinase
MMPVGGSATLGPIGRTIHGRYEIKRLLGQGGMGGVYEGEHLEIGKRVAIKLVHALHARDPHIAARIKQEARSTSAIESENIVQVFDAGEDPELGIFLVMEMLKGGDLASILLWKRYVAPIAAATIILQAAQGLSRAHAAGVVHRDLKPANVFLATRDDGSATVKLVDFGIAKLVREANQANRTPGLTHTGMVIGTPQYMSPEQAQGLATVDHRTDIYSLGAVLYEACVGKSPFQEMPTYEQTIVQIVTRPAPRISAAIPEIDPRLDQLCADMMAHDPAARPRDMATLRERLIGIFPEIEGARLTMGSLTNEIGLLMGEPSRGGSGQVHVALDGMGFSGVGLAVQRGSTGGRRSSFPAASVADAPVEETSGLPSRRKGALIGVVAVLALVAAIGALAITKVHRDSAPPPVEKSFGLVQSTVSIPAPAETPTAAAPIPPPVAAPLPQPEAVPPPTVSHAPAGKPTKAAATSGGEAARRKAAPVSEGKAPPVGGTSESTEF